MNQHTKSKMTPDDGALSKPSVATIELLCSDGYSLCAPCGCNIDDLDAGTNRAWTRCPLHAAAEETLLALEGMIEAFVDGPKEPKSGIEYAHWKHDKAVKAQAAIFKARGQ